MSRQKQLHNQEAENVEKKVKSQFDLNGKVFVVTGTTASSSKIFDRSLARTDSGKVADVA